MGVPGQVFSIQGHVESSGISAEYLEIIRDMFPI